MIPDPLHPAVIHFPIVLAVLAPFLAAAAALAIHKKRLPIRGWLGIVIFQVALVGSVWVAMESGEHEEDQVGHIVAERPIEEHEEAAERFQVLAVLVLPLAAAGLLAGGIGTFNRALTVVVSLVALAAAGSAGHSGGELVYRHGAATAYTQLATGEASGPLAFDRHHEEDDEYDD